MERMPQTFANHAKFDPLYHFVLSPLVLVLMVGAIWAAVREGTGEAWWRVGVAVALFLIVAKLRLYSLRVQDRVIRLEERLRLQAVLAEPLRSRVMELTPGNLIALRFASDEELPALVERVLREKPPAKEIKKAIRNWRPDYFRV
jgi:hypothetical protein